jgi:hypothetical protein
MESMFLNFNKNKDLINRCNYLINECYNTSYENITINALINGEYLEIKEGNQLVDQNNYIDPSFDEKLKLCKLPLYSYQINAIKRIREIELEGKIKINNNYLVTNIAHLHLQIGSGKSVIFLFLSLFYRDIPPHPIIISTNPMLFPETEMIQFKNYPFYYENGAYNPEEINCVQVLSNYQQRRLTVLITHFHLIEQMRTYLNNDFDKAIMKTINIQIVKEAKSVEWGKSEGLVIIPVTAENMKQLSILSYIKPFMRIIIDDYTSMSEIGAFRQILSSFTLFVSGSGFDREERLIPTSYYTMKGLGTLRNCLSLVGRPEEIAKGIFRDNISMSKLVGSSCEFEQYEFINRVEELSLQTYRMNAIDLFPILKKAPFIQHYFSLMWLLQNGDKLQVMISRIMNDVNEGKFPISKIKNFQIWRKEFAIKSFGKDRDLYNSPLFERILLGDIKPSPTASSPILIQKCMNCMKDSQYHYGFGVISLCCGAFYCKDCLKVMTTKKINVKSNTYFTDNDYWCISCREKNPKFYLNSSKMKDKNVYSYILVDEYMLDSEQLKDNIKFDYWFYMFKHGLIPKYHEGRTIYVKSEEIIIESSDDLPTNEGIINSEKIKKLMTLSPKDQLGLKILYCVNEIMKDLELIPKKGTKAIFFGSPPYIQSRIVYVYNELCKDSQAPIKNFEIVFRDNAESLIGAHQMTQLMVIWNDIKNQDEFLQCISRIIRLNSWQISLYFLFILSTSS